MAPERHALRQKHSEFGSCVSFFFFFLERLRSSFNRLDQGVHKQLDWDLGVIRHYRLHIHIITSRLEHSIAGLDWFCIQ